MTAIKKTKVISLAFLILYQLSCTKRDEFLNAKPQESLATITKLSDAEKLMNNEALFNHRVEPQLGELSSDDYYISDATWLAAYQNEQNGYIWAKQIYPIGKDVPDWNKCYQQIYVCNVVLEATNKMKIQPQEEANLRKVQGAALFFRGYAFYNLVQTFSLAFNPNQSKSQLGIPLRLNSDLNEKSSRSTVDESYNQIIRDLKAAAQLLPRNVERITLPNKAAAYGMLSRIYLAMSDYQNCQNYSDSCLRLHDNVTDFNGFTTESFTLTSTNAPYFEEDIFHTTAAGLNILLFNNAIVDSTLYALYDSTDLRKSYFFMTYQNQIRFKGSLEFRYFGGYFTGISTSEVLLNRAECNARKGKISDSMNDLNKILIKRYKSGTYSPRTASTHQEATALVLTERRKELCFRGIRWTDLRRLNQDPQYAKTLTRRINGLTYTLPPNDPRYALPIPDNEIVASGIVQNAR